MEDSSSKVNQLENTIRKLEKEKNTLNEKLELSSKSMMSEHGGLEKKIERVQEERDRIKEDFEVIKADRDRKIDEMKRQFEREKDILKQKNNDLQ
jgi:predicted  nucleic acid-binding Zn-ribbon protein